MTLNHEERDAAERRIDEIRHEIKAILNGTAPTEAEIGRWQSLLEESMALQLKLEEGRP
jgi:hypothetical protein